MSIFGAVAQQYWDAGLPVIPLKKRAKVPFFDAWQRFCEVMPPEDTRKSWIRQYPDNNIGLPLGPCSGLVAIDLDTDDPGIRATLESLLPPTPWIRRGAKGAVFMYRWHEHRSFKIFRGEDAKRPILECLSKGNQVVMPGSIHPDTGQPYVATGDLWAMAKSLPMLPKDVETLLRQGLIDSGVSLSLKGAIKVTEWVAAGARDTSMIGLAGLLARDVGRGFRTLEQAYDEMRTWCTEYVERVAGDPIDPQKGCQRILEFMQRDVVEKNRSLPKDWDAGLPEEARDVAVKALGEDAEEWDVQQINDYLDEKFMQVDRKSPQRRAVVEEVLQRIAKARNLTNLDVDQVLQYIMQCSGRTLTVSALRKRVDELSGGGVEGTDHTQIAQKLVEDLQRYGDIRFHADKFWQYQGSHWEVLPEIKLLTTIANEFGDMPAARRFSDHRGIVKVAQALVSGPLQSEPTVGLNFANGFLTSDLQLLPHNPSYGAVYTLPYLYRPPEDDVTPQKFESFLYQCWGRDPDYAAKVQGLREAIAVTMFGLAPRFQRAVCLFGMPHSGKSVLKDIVMGLMPYGTISSVAPHDWGDKFLPTEMFGKLANFCGELSETELIPGNRFKEIIDGDKINGQYKGRDIFEFRPVCAHWFASNHMPRTRDSSAGFSRRWLFLTFNHAVASKDRIQNLQEDILTEERDLITAWAVQCLPALQMRNGYTLSASHEAQVNEMATMNNSVRYFLVAGGVKMEDPSASKRQPRHTSEIELHNAYFSFCKLEARAQPVSLKVFRARMTEMQHEFGFAIRVQRSQSGTEEAMYENLTLAARTQGVSM